MATLAQLDPAAKVYRKQNFDWRQTRIGYTPLGLGSDPFVTDAAVAAFDQRKEMHRVLDKACCDKGIEQDKAQRMHARLDRLLDEQPDFFSKLNEEEIEPENEEELPLIDLAADEPSETQKTNKQETGRDDRPEVALDSGKCSACRIADNHVPPKKTVALDAAQRNMADTVITFWRQYGINLEKAG